MSFSPLPRLRTAATKSDVDIKYDSGASYKGKRDSQGRKGYGLFTWHNNAKYEGEFNHNQREGQGCQTWPDGSQYQGDFCEDLRHGWGVQCWSDSSTYTGTFFRDRRHGKGSYTWADGSKFIGTFYIDKREGYGKFTHINGDIFEGSYRNDERFGPGILTRSDGSQDIGLWQGEQMLKVLLSAEQPFSISLFSDLAYDARDHVKTVPLPGRMRNRRSVIDYIIHPPEIFKYDDSEKLDGHSKRIFSDSLHPDSLAMDYEVFENEFFRDVPTAKIDSVEAIALNSTPTLLYIQQHIHRYKHMEDSLSFKVKAVLHGPRAAFKSATGHLEKQSVALINAAAAGDSAAVHRLLIAGEVSPDVADILGMTALHAAAMNCHKEVINLMLDYGADVNKLSDEGVTALAMCLVSYYSVESFKDNIAEQEMTITKSQGVGDSNSVTAIPSHLKTTASTKQIAEVGQATTLPPVNPSVPVGDSGFESRKEAVPYHASSSEADDSPAVTPASEDAGSPENVKQEETLLAAASKSPSIVSMLSVKAKPAPSEAEDVEEGDADDNISNLSSEVLSRGSAVPNDDFRSDDVQVSYDIEVTEGLIDRCATALSTNAMVTKRENHSANIQEKSRILAKSKAEKQVRWETIQLLLRRGANPNGTSVPMPALMFTIKSGDLEATKLLLLKGANANMALPAKKGGLSPLHLAVATPGEEGIVITECVLNALADPDYRAEVDNSYLDPEDDWSKMDNQVDEDALRVSGGRTPLHIACSRDDNYKHAAEIVHLLLEHKANPNVLCNGHSPLSLAIISGNDLAIQELVKFGADPSMFLTHGNGNALCVASHTAYEHRWAPDTRIMLIDRLVNAGADILAMIPMGPKKICGTALDYAYYIFNLDRRIAHMPYHALSHAERETYNARRALLGHMGNVVRQKCIEKEKKRIEEEAYLGQQSRTPSARFLFTGAGTRAPVVRGPDGKLVYTDGRPITSDGGRVTFEAAEKDGEVNLVLTLRKPLFKYCYSCGRSVNVRLTACTRCKEVYFCSKACKVKAWNAGHKDECIRIQDTKTPTRAAGNARSAPAKLKKLEQSNDDRAKRSDAYRGSLLDKSYNMTRRPTDRNLVPLKGLSGSYPKLAGKGQIVVRHNQHGGRVSPDLTPHITYTDNYSFV